MPYEIHSHCDRCNGGDAFLIGNWPEHLGVFVCRTCKKVVNIPVEDGQCPGCGHQPEVDEFYDYAFAIPYFDGQLPHPPEPGPRCPKCGEGTLSFENRVHLNMLMVRANAEKARVAADRDYMEKAIFLNSMMPVIDELQLDTRELLDYFHLSPPTGPPVTKRLSFPIFMDIRTHVISRLALDPGTFGCKLSHEESVGRMFGDEELPREPPEFPSPAPLPVKKKRPAITLVGIGMAFLALLLWKGPAALKHAMENADRAGHEVEQRNEERQFRAPPGVVNDFLEHLAGSVERDKPPVATLAPEQLRFERDEMEHYLRIAHLHSQDAFTEDAIRRTRVAQKAQRIYDEYEAVLDSLSDKERAAYDAFFQRSIDSIGPDCNLNSMRPHTDWDQIIAFAYRQLGVNIDLANLDDRDKLLLYCYETCLASSDRGLIGKEFEVLDTRRLYAAPQEAKTTEGDAVEIPFVVMAIKKAKTNGSRERSRGAVSPDAFPAERDGQLPGDARTDAEVRNILCTARPMSKKHAQLIAEALIEKSGQPGASEPPDASPQ